MLNRNTPAFRANHVGSLVRPPALMAERSNPNAAAARLRALEDEAIGAAVKLQEEVGFAVVTDGEIRRRYWTDFLTSLSHVESAQGQMNLRFNSAQGPVGQVIGQYRITGKLGRPGPILVDDFNFLKGLTKAIPKVTIPSPSLLHFRGGRAAIDRAAYPEMAEFFADVAHVYNAELIDLAHAGCRYLQLDEVDFAFLCDPRIRAEVKRLGEDPDALPQTYARLINESISARPADMTIAMHLCRGNYKNAWLADGGYEPVAEVLFNTLNVNVYYLEFDSPRAGDFSPLRFLPEGKLVVLGLLTTKRNTLESKDEIKRRLEEASRHVALDQLALSPQCGFASNSEGATMSFEEQAAKMHLVMDVAREVWGSN